MRGLFFWGLPAGRHFPKSARGADIFDSINRMYRCTGCHNPTFKSCPSCKSCLELTMYSCAGGTFYDRQIRNPNMQLSYLQIRHRLKTVLYFMSMVWERAALSRGRVVICICLAPPSTDIV